VLDVARLDGGAPYLVMEHLQGVDLATLSHSRGPLPIDEAVGYLLQAGEAIAEAHQRGIVHRDLKPSNLFLVRRADGTALVKVLDFGISKMIDPAGAPPLTRTADLLGTPYYMSPEQLVAAKEVDPRADVWALGVVLHQLLSARMPFEAPAAPNVIARIVGQPPTPLRDHRADAPVGLEEAVLRCLEKDRARRFESVAHLARALAPYAPQAAASVERIGRTLEGPGAAATTVAVGRKPSAKAPIEPAAGASTDGGLSSNQRAIPRLRRPGAATVGMGSALIALAVLIGASQRGRRPPAPEPSPAATPSLTVAAAPEEPAPPVSVAPVPTPPPPASASAPLPASRSERPPSSPPARKPPPDTMGTPSRPMATVNPYDSK
jgi:serine/threonine-protein kinase